MPHVLQFFDTYYISFFCLHLAISELRWNVVETQVKPSFFSLSFLFTALMLTTDVPKRQHATLSNAAKLARRNRSALLKKELDFTIGGYQQSAKDLSLKHGR